MNCYKRQKLCHDSNDSYLQFDGNIIYHDKAITANRVLAQLLNKINKSDPLNNKIVVGFDCEWRAFPRPSKVCLIQICLESNDCHLFHLSAMDYTVPTLLESFIVHKNCIKVGLNIMGDFFKLQRDYGLGLDDVLISQSSIVDLSAMANKMLGKSNTWSLSRLSEFLLHKPIQKELAVSNWSKKPLTASQQMYAAVDAFASLQLYYEIKMNAIPFGF